MSTTTTEATMKRTQTFPGTACTRVEHPGRAFCKASGCTVVLDCQAAKGLTSKETIKLRLLNKKALEAC